MNTLEFAEKFLSDQLTLDELHLRLHEQDAEGVDDADGPEARRLIGEATSAGWSDGTVKREFERFIGRTRLNALDVGMTHESAAGVQLACTAGVSMSWVTSSASRSWLGVNGGSSTSIKGLVAQA